MIKEDKINVKYTNKFDFFPIDEGNRFVIDQRFVICQKLEDITHWAWSYKAYDIENEVDVEIKFPRNQYGEEAIRRMLYLSQKVDHENLISIIDWRINGGYVFLNDEFCTSNASYIVTEYPNFKSLYFYLNNGRNFSEKMAKFFFEQIIDVVEILHKHGFVKLDLHPSNFVIIRDNKMLDDKIILKFIGLDSWIEYDNDLNFKDESSNMHQRQSWVKSDISLIGELLFWMVIGWKPYARKSDKDVLFKLVTTDPDLYLKTHPILNNRFIDKTISDEILNLFILLLQWNSSNIVNFHDIQNHYWMIKTNTPYKYFSIGVLESIMSETNKD